jgi:hypothetical protein
MDDYMCSESKDASRARFVHVRLGLDEPPEPMVCKCKDPSMMLDSIARNYATAVSTMTIIPNTTVDLLPSAIMNAVEIRSLSSKANREVEVRLDHGLAEHMFKKMLSWNKEEKPSLDFFRLCLRYCSMWASCTI